MMAERYFTDSAFFGLQQVLFCFRQRPTFVPYKSGGRTSEWNKFSFRFIVRLSSSSSCISENTDCTCLTLDLSFAQEEIGAFCKLRIIIIGLWVVQSVFDLPKCFNITKSVCVSSKLCQTSLRDVTIEHLQKNYLANRKFTSGERKSGE